MGKESSMSPKGLCRSENRSELQDRFARHEASWYQAADNQRVAFVRESSTASALLTECTLPALEPGPLSRFARWKVDARGWLCRRHRWNSSGSSRR